MVVVGTLILLFSGGRDAVELSVIVCFTGAFFLEYFPFFECKIMDMIPIKIMIITINMTQNSTVDEVLSGSCFSVLGRIILTVSSASSSTNRRYWAAFPESATTVKIISPVLLPSSQIELCDPTRSCRHKIRLLYYCINAIILNILKFQ